MILFPTLIILKQVWIKSILEALGLSNLWKWLERRMYLREKKYEDKKELINKKIKEKIEVKTTKDWYNEINLFDIRGKRMVKKVVKNIIDSGAIINDIVILDNELVIYYTQRGEDKIYKFYLK